MQFSLPSRHLILLSNLLLPYCRRPSFTPIQKQRQNYSLYIQIFRSLDNIQDRMFWTKWQQALSESNLILNCSWIKFWLILSPNIITWGLFSLQGCLHEMLRMLDRWVDVLYMYCDVVCETDARETVSLVLPRASCEHKQEMVCTVAVITATGKEAVNPPASVATSAGKRPNDKLTKHWPPFPTSSAFSCIISYIQQLLEHTKFIFIQVMGGVLFRLRNVTIVGYFYYLILLNISLCTVLQTKTYIK
jgi:hypothetical protein